jgi:magnesium chelatase subunit ChlD-like protein
VDAVPEGAPAVESLQVDPARVFEHRRRLDRIERARLGRRARSLVGRRRGKYTRHRLARPGDHDLALDATLRAALVRTGRAPVAITRDDLRRKIREHRSPFSVCFVVDNSWSVHAERMVEKVKGVVFELLEDATRRGDKVSLVAFRGGVAEATVALPPTSSRARARRRLEDIPLSGQTPLADALRRARLLLRGELLRHPNAVPLVVVVSDGLPTVPVRRGADPVADLLAEGRALRRARIGCVVAEVAQPEHGCAAALAEASGGTRLPLTALAASLLVEAVEEAV